MRLCIAAPSLFALAALIPVHAAAATADATAPETELVDNVPVKVTSKKELTLGVAADPDVATRELWYRSYDGKAWAAWQKHGIGFAKDTPITWAAPEGHWQLAIRKVLTSGLAGDIPDEKNKGQAEIIVDRTAPTVAINFPGAKAKLRGGDKYAVTWKADDLHLRSAPVTIRWSRDGKGSFEDVAVAIANNGAYDWTVPRDMTTSGVLRIEAADKAGNVGNAESVAILVDSIKPKGKVVSPAISAALEIPLALEIKDEGPAGLASAQLWISQDDGVSWTQGPFIQDPRTVTWKAPADGKYRLAVVPEDQAGNRGPTPKGKADDQFQITVDTTAPVISLASAIGIIPADKAAPTAQRDFKPGDNVQVAFTVKDVNLEANTIAVYFQADAAGEWKELGVKQAADTAFRFAVPKAETKTARIKVTATDQAGNLGETIASETFAIQTQVKVDPVIIEGL